MLIAAVLAGSFLANGVVPADAAAERPGTIAGAKPGTRVATAARDLDASIQEGARSVRAAMYAEAETLLRSVLDKIGVSDPRRGPVLNNLAVALYYLGRLQEAETLYLRAMAAMPAGSTQETTSVTSNLATLNRRTRAATDRRASLSRDAANPRGSGAKWAGCGDQFEQPRRVVPDYGAVRRG